MFHGGHHAYVQPVKSNPGTYVSGLVGDIDQLPSVGAGNVLRDMINSERIGGASDQDLPSGTGKPYYHERP